MHLLTYSTTYIRLKVIQVKAVYIQCCLVVITHSCCAFAKREIEELIDVVKNMFTYYAMKFDLVYIEWNHRSM